MELIGKLHTSQFGECDVLETKYASGGTAVVIRQQGEPIATLSVNIPEAPLKPRMFHAKGWSENEQIFEDARKSGLFKEINPIGTHTGFVRAPIWEIIPK